MYVYTVYRYICVNIYVYTNIYDIYIYIFIFTYIAKKMKGVRVLQNTGEIKGEED